MLRDEPTLRPGLYRMPEQPIGPRALIPAFRQATSVRGAFGWFSAGWISRLAPGLAVYLNREDAGPIQFTVSPKLFPREFEKVSEAATLSPAEASERVASLFTADRPTEDALASHALDCLAWMLSTDQLTLRIAVPHPWSSYHPKIWLFRDGEERVVVRGSGNATDKGVYAGVEHMDVDVSWDEGGDSRIREAISMLDDWEGGRSTGIESVHSLDEAVANDILETAPDAPPTLEDYLRSCSRDDDPIYAVTPGMRTENRERRAVPSLRIPDQLDWQSPPYGHQEEAVAAWEKGGGADEGQGGEHGVIAMATGAGKTITALICATRAQDRREGESFIVVVSAPSNPLLRQWKEEIEAFDVDPIIPTFHTKGTTYALTQATRRFLREGTHVVLVTNHLLSTSEFQESIRRGAEDADADTMLIGDEAHTLGATGFISDPPEFFDLRLGLSATPERQYDPDGTEALLSFFGDTVYEFGLSKAIGFCLVPYNYHVHATTLGGEELSDFVELSTRIGAKLGKGEELDDEGLTRLLIQRRRIVETAGAKVRLFQDVLEERGPRRISHALVYASSKNPEQFAALRRVLDRLGIVYAEVTEEQSSDRELLGSIFETFSQGDCQILLAKKVLDEGVDIPSIREAFLVASSTVEREWIQRRGRVLRKHEGKSHAVVHDFLALPPVEYFEGGGSASVKRVVANELGRATTFAKHASNASGEDGVLAHIQAIRSSFWGDGAAGRLLRKEGNQVVAPDTPSGRIA